jgi:predicted DNA-binding protein (UPF0251 family)
MKYNVAKKSYDGRWRNPKPRIIWYTPLLTIWRPIDKTISTDKIRLGYDEIEAIRLKYLDGMHIIEAAELMGISKTLFANIVNRAVWKVAEGLIFGKILEIEGENPERDFKEPIL